MPECPVRGKKVLNVKNVLKSEKLEELTCSMQRGAGSQNNQGHKCDQGKAESVTKKRKLDLLHFASENIWGAYMRKSTLINSVLLDREIDIIGLQEVDEKFCGDPNIYSLKDYKANQTKKI